MTTTDHELGASVGQWNALVRRARIGRDRKAAALVVSSYARANGTGIHCGVARVAVDLECSHRTARRYLAWLREVGLIELVRAGNRRRGHSDEYRLILGPDVLENIEVPDPAAYKLMCDEAQQRGRSSRDVTDGAVDNFYQGSSFVSHDLPQPDADQGSSLVSHENADQGSNEARSGVTLDDPPSSTYISQGRSTSQADDEDPRTDVAVGGSSAPRPPENTKRDHPPAVVVEIRPGASREPPHLSRRWSTRGQEAIAEATARVAARKAANQARKEAT